MERFAQFDHDVNGMIVHPISGALVCAQSNGDVVSVSAPAPAGAKARPGEEAQTTLLVRTGGHPSDVAFDSTGRMFVADQAHKAILTYAPGEPITELVNEYEDEPFRGPNSLVVSDDSTIYFTDSGPLGTTSIERPYGSVFAITGSDHLLIPILQGCLAHPSGICLSPDQTTLYVAETGLNRILRLVQSKYSAQVFYSSVFYTFNGGFGPLGLAMDKETGNLLVSMFDVADTPGHVAVINRYGQLVSMVPVVSEVKNETCSEVSAIAMGSDQFMYVSEQSTQSVYRIPIKTIAKRN